MLHGAYELAGGQTAHEKTAEGAEEDGGGEGHDGVLPFVTTGLARPGDIVRVVLLL